MSTPAPDTFDPHAFPAGLLAAQRQAAELYAALRAHQATLPWSREPHDGWPEETERGRENSGRPASPGRTAAEANEFDRLLDELPTATAQVQCHPWWKRCEAEGIKGEAMVAARQALKHAEGAVPLGRSDVETAA
ncbi:hypothetical protein B9W62_35660 [Streptomyces sp. CS113]|uniref:hypothetical protein n=1 Tax=Streptomyces sp. CS113 TaxID=1982761 RepID=UPI000B42221D|nr:hypothetical protein [Streptomyces sp. CS113]OWA00977.1 hypothetical protein B9W62_35660 [Streptomyces sp. CS113]